MLAFPRLQLKPTYIIRNSDLLVNFVISYIVSVSVVTLRHLRVVFIDKILFD